MDRQNPLYYVEQVETIHTEELRGLHETALPLELCDLICEYLPAARVHRAQHVYGDMHVCVGDYSMVAYTEGPRGKQVIHNVYDQCVWNKAFYNDYVVIARLPRHNGWDTEGPPAICELFRFTGDEFEHLHQFTFNECWHSIRYPLFTHADYFIAGSTACSYKPPFKKWHVAAGRDLIQHQDDGYAVAIDNKLIIDTGKKRVIVTYRDWMTFDSVKFNGSCATCHNGHDTWCITIE